MPESQVLCQSEILDEQKVSQQGLNYRWWSKFKSDECKTSKKKLQYKFLSDYIPPRADETLSHDPN